MYTLGKSIRNRRWGSLSETYDRLINYANKKGLSTRQLAGKIGVKYSTLTKWKHREPSPENATKVRIFFQKESDTVVSMFEKALDSSETDVVTGEAVAKKKGIERPIVPENISAGKRNEGTPLSKEQAKMLLEQHEIIRDPVHHDIWITTLERAIIDMFAVQRLRLLMQLGPTYLVYPGATHTRLIHSIGTVHCAEQLVQIVNRNFDVYSQESLIRIDSYPHLLIRICALLHDLAHIPFGHTLENEGNLGESEWKDPKRAELWLGDDSDLSVAKTIRRFLIEFGLRESNVDQIIEDIRRYVLLGNSEKHPDYPLKDYPMDLEYPFILDLVGNTLCADLLDYLDRDMYFCGLRERSGDRVVKYLAVARVIRNSSGELEEEFRASDNPSIGKGRLVLLAYRFEREHFAGGKLKYVHKSEILSEAIDLLRRRFALAEKVYFHRTKTAASAMLISAMGSSSITLNEIYTDSDSDLIYKLKTDISPRAKHLIAAYEARRLYKPVYKINYREKREEDQQSLKIWEQIYPKFRDANQRKKREEELETMSNLPPGSIVIYCPESGMNLKQFEMLVQSRPDGEIKYLKNILDPNRRREMDTINERFAQLWKLQIFVDPQALDVSIAAKDDVRDLNALCESVIDLPNDIPELQRQGRSPRDQIADRVIREWEEAGKPKVPHHIFNELVGASHRGSGSELIESFRNHLKVLMESE